jgi:hypothetical protein
MKRFKALQACLAFTMIILSVLMTGCGSEGQTGHWLPSSAPTVTAVVPLNNAPSVAINTKTITAAFSEAMNPDTLTTASFTLACGGTPVTGGGAVTYLAADNMATLPLPAATNLPPSTVCTATITTAAEDVDGYGLANNYVWTFTTAADNTAPTVTAVVPLNNATGVAINTKKITAAFSEPMDPATLTTASFTLSCGGPITGGGAVTYQLAGSVATLPLPAADLQADTLCTATITTAAEDLAGNALASNYVWTFRTGLTRDTTRPRVTSTFPATTIPGPTTGVPANTAITATFNEDMSPATINAASFTLTGPGTTPVAGVSVPVTYVIGGRTATFTPAAPLTAGTTYTATITTAATDLANNALAGNQAALPAASNYLWTFTVVAAVPPAHITVASVFPVNLAPAVCPGSSISATFTVPSGLKIDPATVVAGTTFIVTGPSPAVTAVDGSVALDATGRIATFTPLSTLAVGTYTATIKGGAIGVKDLALPQNTMVSDRIWTFTVVPATGVCLAPIPLNSAAPFGSLSCAALSGSTMGPTGTTVNGDIGTTLTHTSITNFVGGGTPATPGIVNGTIYASDLPNPGDLTSATAVADAYLAFQAAQTVGATGTVIPTSDLGAIAGFGPNPLTPGTFKAGAYASGSSIAISTAMTLDPQGDANAVWIFYAPTTLTTSGTGNIILLAPAQAKNVFWVVGSSATLGAPAFSGNILAATAISVTTTGVTVDGRLLVSGPTCAAVTWDAHLHTLNVPAP